MSMLEPLAITRTQACLRAYTKAVERVRQAESEDELAFAELMKARKACAEEGLAVDVELSAGMAAAYAEWKQREAAREGREIVRGDLDDTHSRRASLGWVGDSGD
jgi:hypothetical protein